MYAPISISLLAIASFLATTSAAPVPESQTKNLLSDLAYPNILGDSSSTASTGTPNDPTTTGDSIPVEYNPPAFETFSVPSFTQPGWSHHSPVIFGFILTT